MKKIYLLTTICTLLFFTDSYGQGNTFPTSGNVGIGTTSPTSTLDVRGRGGFGYGPIYLDWTHEPSWAGHSDKWAGYLGFNAYRDNEDPKDNYKGGNRYTSKGVIEGSNYGFRFLFRNHNNYDSDGQHPLVELMRITNNGNVGIGTNNPNSFKLAVEGKIGAREIQVTSVSPWPDFVFLKDYRLRPLYEVEEFINKNGHLPEIPSAKEVEGNGINLGEMDAKLLQKIEELTLYMIELKKENEAMKEENKTMREQIRQLQLKQL